MLIYTPDQLTRLDQNQIVKRRTATPLKVEASNTKQEREQNKVHAPYSGDRRRQRDRRKLSITVRRDRRQDDRRSLYLRTCKRIRTFIGNSDNPSAPGGNQHTGKIIYEKV